MLAKLTRQLAGGGSLTRDQVREVVALLVAETLAPETKADFLSALARKGESIEEITAFAEELRARSVPVPIPSALHGREILDVVGTGGDRLGTFNISTASALVAAAGGITVAKHGNRAYTSQTGSADVLEALGIRTDLPPEEAVAWLLDLGFAFFFAPRYHPAFKQIAPARKLCADRGQRTLFNFLGPLLNPARPTAQLLGVARPELCEAMARALQSLGVRRGMVVCGGVASESETGSDRPAGMWMDELSVLGESTVAEFYQDHGFNVSRLSVTAFPLQRCLLGDLRGGNPAANALTIRALLAGTERGPKRDALLLNAAAALFVAGGATSMTQGWELAAALLDSGAAASKLEALVRASRG